MEGNGPIKAGTAGGFLFVLLNISSAEVVKTAVLASVGAVVSFTVSLMMRKLVNKLKRK